MSLARNLSILSLAACLCTPGTVTAQDALVIKTANEEIAEQVLDTFDGKSLPELTAGKHFVFSLGADGKLAVATGEGDVGMFQLRARPARLAEQYAEQIAETQQQIGMYAGMAAGQMGVPPNELNDLVTAFFAFPAQVETLSLDVTGSPKAGFDATLDLGPAEKGWFATYLLGMKPTSLGAPQLASKDALLSFALDCDPSLLLATFRPFLGFAVGAAATDKEERAKYTGLMEQFAGLMDGTMAMVLERDGSGMRSISGLLDGAKAIALFGNADYQKFIRAAAEANPMADVEVTEKALVHREIAFSKQVVETGQDTPMTPNGTATTLTGVAGSFQINGPNEAVVKALTDQVLDQKLERKALSGGAILAVSARLAELVEGMSGGMAQMGDDAPQTAQISLGQTNGKLRVTVKLGF